MIKNKDLHQNECSLKPKVKLPEILSSIDRFESLLSRVRPSFFLFSLFRFPRTIFESNEVEEAFFDGPGWSSSFSSSKHRVNSQTSILTPTLAGGLFEDHLVLICHILSFFWIFDLEWPRKMSSIRTFFVKIAKIFHFSWKKAPWDHFELSLNERSFNRFFLFFRISWYPENISKSFYNRLYYFLVKIVNRSLKSNIFSNARICYLIILFSIKGAKIEFGIITKKYAIFPAFQDLL